MGFETYPHSFSTHFQSESPKKNSNILFFRAKQTTAHFFKIKNNEPSNRVKNAFLYQQIKGRFFIRACMHVKTWKNKAKTVIFLNDSKLFFICGLILEKLKILLSLKTKVTYETLVKLMILNQVFLCYKFIFTIFEILKQFEHHPP